MNNFGIATSATTTAINSQGSSMKEQEKYSDSLEARINRLDTAWNKFTISMGNAFLTDTLIGGIETLNSLATSASKFIDTFGALGAIFGIIGVATVGLSAKFRVFSTSLIFGTTNMSRMQLASAGLTAGMGRLGIATVGVKTAFRGLVASTGVGLLFVGIGIVIEKLIGKYSEAKQASEEFAQSQQKEADSLTNNKQEIEHLISQYSGLSEIKDRSVKQEQLYLSVQTKLGELFPSLISYVDGAGQAHLKSKDAIDQEIKSTNALIEAKKLQAQIDAKKDISKAMGKRDDIQGNIDRVKKELETPIKSVGFGENRTYVQKSEEDIKQLKSQLLIYQNQWSSAAQVVTSKILTIAEAYTKLQIDPSISNGVNDFFSSFDTSKLDVTQLESFAMQAGALQDFMQKAYKSGDEEGFDKAKQGMIDLAQAMGATKQQAYGFSMSFDDLVKSAEAGASAIFAGKDGMDGLDETVTGLDGNMDGLSGTTDGLSGSFGGLSGAASGATSALGGNINAAQILLGVTSDEIQILGNAIGVFQALSGQQGLSAEQSGLLAQATSILAAQYPQLNGQISENIGWISSQVGMMGSLSDVSGANTATMIANQNSTTRGTIAQINQRISGYQKEASALSALMARIEASYPERGMSGASSYAYHNAQTRLGELNAQLATAQASRIEAYYGSGVKTGQVKPYTGSSSSGGSGGSGSKSNKPSSSSSANDAKQASEDAQQRILDKVEAQLNAYEQRKSAYDDEITMEKYYADQVSNTTIQFRNRTKSLLEYYGKVKSAHHQEIYYLDQELRTNKKLTTSQQAELKKRLSDLRNEAWQLEGTIADVQKSLKDSVTASRDYMTQKADDFIDAYKQFYEKKKELDQKALDDELSGYEKMIQEKIDLIDKQEDETNFTKDLSNRQKEIADIQSKINLFSMDSSQTGKVADLKKDLADKQLELNDFLHSREVDQRKEALNQELEAKRLQIEEEKKLSDQHYEDLLNDERNFAKMREDILKGNVTSFTTMLTDFSTLLQSNMGDIGQSITENLIDKIAEASNGLKLAKQQYADLFKVYVGSNTDVSGTNTASKADKVTIKEDTPLLKKTDDGYELTSRLLKKGETYSAYGTSTDGVYNVGGNQWVTADPKFTKYQKFESGGGTGDGEGFAWLDKKEIVLNKMDTANFLKAIDITRSISSLIPKFTIPKVTQNPIPQQSNVTMNVNIERVEGGEKGANDFIKFVNNKLRGQGGLVF